MSNTYVLDACALLAVARNEVGADIVVDIYRRANNGEVQLIINRINLLEVYYDFYRYNGKEYANDFARKVEQSVVKLTEFDESLFEEAGRLKATHRISLADSIALAQALILGGELLTADHHEFDVIETKENIGFCWIR